MEPKKRSASLWNVLLLWAAHACESSDRQISRLMGRSEDFVGYCRRARKKGATLEETFGLVEAIGLPDWLIFGKLFPQPSRPAELLQRLWDHLRKDEGPAAEAPALVAQAQEVWTSLLAAPPVLSVEPPRSSLRRRLVWIQEQRFRNGAEALGQLEAEIAGLLRALGAVRRAEPGQIGDLAYALALWGDLQRALGDLDRAFLGCRLALDFAERSEDRWTTAQCLWMGAMLLHDLGFPEYGVPWLERAACLFALDQHGVRLPELLVAQGLLLAAAGREEMGNALLREALTLLPASERRWRHAALLHLATAAQEAGEASEALARLEVLSREHLAQDALQGLIQWRKAAALLTLGELAPAVETFSKALAQVAEHGEPADAVSVLCDFAEQLVQKGEPGTAGMLAGQLLRSWKLRSPGRHLAEIVEDFYATTRLRPLSRADIDLTRARLKEQCPPRAAFPERPFQPASPA